MFLGVCNTKRGTSGRIVFKFENNVRIEIGDYCQKTDEKERGILEHDFELSGLGSSRYFLTYFSIYDILTCI